MPRKSYGPKMSNPKIAFSKEKRNCGPIGRYTKHKKQEFTSVKPKSQPKLD